MGVRKRPGCSGKTDAGSPWKSLASNWVLPLAAVLLCLVLLTGTVAGLELVVGIGINGFEVVIAAFVTAVGLALRLSETHGRRWLLPWGLIVGAATGVVLPSLVLTGRVLDDTWDGQWFHQEAVIQLAGGWNPFRSELGEREVPDEGARTGSTATPRVRGCGRPPCTG